VGRDLESPRTAGDLYRARGDEVAPHRPVFTGDVFVKVPCHGLAESKTKTVMIVHHPCALRSNGVDLHPRLAVHEVRQHRAIQADRWEGYLNMMPLPDLDPSVTSGRRHRAAIFDAPGLVSADDLDPSKRIACLSPVGVNLLLQRWVHFTSRVVVPTYELENVTSAAYAEADLIEEWCEHRIAEGVDVGTASTEALMWLREAPGGVSRQDKLKNPQQRSTVRREMRAAFRDPQT
jgi:hypothetical protein